MNLDDSLLWLALGLTPGLGPRLTGKLLSHFGEPEQIFSGNEKELTSRGLPSAVAQSLIRREALPRAEKELVKLREIGGQLVHWEESEYPSRLKEIYDPPPLLYVKGDLQVLRRHSISMVGTRRPSLYGNLMAERLGRDLTERGLVIVSGLARGIDSSSHKGACASVRGAAIGVLGTGIDVLYPKENKKLFAEVEKRGAIISEFPLGTHPSPENFPVRNRIVAGMSLGTIIVEGQQYSGSLITARLAMEFGREVFGVPGSVTQEVSFAPNQLIKQGAKLVTSAEDVIEELPTPVRAALLQAEQPEAELRNRLVRESLEGGARKIYGLLQTDEPMHIDDIVERSGLNSSEVLATLFEMEMKGIVRQLPGKQFSKVLL